MTSIPQAILAQLGGNRFVAMTGAKKLVAGERTLSFKIGRNASKANYVVISLLSNDTYTLRFAYVRSNAGPRIVSEHAGIYNHALRNVFTATTGLRCSL